jgi:polyisoprenoid-binding protein YceI
MRFSSGATRASLLCLALVSSLANADWTLDGARSSLNFVTTKAVNVGEVHRFEKLSGLVDEQGRATLRIDLASVATNIPIRDERMRELLFETVRFPEATLSTQVPTAILGKLKAGELKPMTLQGVLGIRGIEAPVTSQVDVVKLVDGSLQVASREPVLVSAGDLNLLDGVERLRTIAGLPSIGQNVSVSFQLNFRQTPN